MSSFLSNQPLFISVPGMDDITEIKALFTTRYGGVSKFPYNTLNLSFQKADSRENVIENYRRLSEQTGILMEQMVLSRQVHGTTVTIADQRHKGMGLVREHRLGETDALITAERGVALVTFYADCTPIYLYDKVQHVIGLVHSGWRGTLENITIKTINMMKQKFNCMGENMIVSIGPHIRQCCFEVGVEVYQQFIETFPNCKDLMEPVNDKWMIDLSGIIRRSLLQEGLIENQIFDINRCTFCERALFFSHRGDLGNTGTGAALLIMNE